jgi:predicted RNA-binding Zn-ribbon protein involved in translation (DUF1610 family)
MTTDLLAAVDARCPLCGESILSVDGGGHVTSEDLHPIALSRRAGEGYMLCDDCGLLAELPTDLTIN